MISLLSNAFFSMGMDELVSIFLARAVGLMALLLLSVAVFYLTYRIILSFLLPLSKRSKTHWDDVLIRHKVIRRLAWLVPAGVFSLFFPILFREGISATWLQIINQLIGIYVVAMIALAGFGFINALIDILRDYEFAREIPLKSLGQALKIFLVILAGILLVATAVGENPLVLLSGLGAFAAVLSFVYQDALRGLVAGLQLTSMGLLATGDLVEVPAHNASGTVTDIGLTTIKIRNADFTITTVPTAALINGSFKNWRGMEESSGRRLKRAVTIDLQTVKFLSDSQKKELARFPAVQQFLETAAASDLPIQPTNIGAFRAYIADLLLHHPQINQELTLLVRQLDPTPHGIPIEVYAFSLEKGWGPYEGIMADIFDHIIAIAPQFGLAIYQAPQRYLAVEHDAPMEKPA